jgi:starch phosphorylase
MNGALLIGTYDGANVEIVDRVGKDNFYLFGKTVEELEELRPKYECTSTPRVVYTDVT